MMTKPAEIEPATSWSSVGRTSNRAPEAGYFVLSSRFLKNGQMAGWMRTYSALQFQYLLHLYISYTVDSRYLELAYIE